MGAKDELEHAQESLNLQGEFLGVTALACYSAPWFLHVVLLFLVGYMFGSKVRSSSRKTRRLFVQMEKEVRDDAEQDHILQDFNRFFFGFTVAKRNLAAYWNGFSIYAISFAYAVANTIEHSRIWLENR